MYNSGLFDAVLNQLDAGDITSGLHLLAGALTTSQAGEHARSELRAHRLHQVLLEDPYTARAFNKPRGYAGDAELIDMIYDQAPPAQAGDRGRGMFAVTTAFPVSRAVRERRHYAEQIFQREWSSGKRICALACGHLREADMLIGQDLANVTAVDQDPLSIARIRHNHGGQITLCEANVLHFLRRASREGERYDLIYTLGLTDYFDDRAMELLHRLMKDCLTPGGTILLANFVPEHIATGWMDAVMDWHLVYRTEQDLGAFAEQIGMDWRTWRDPTGSIAFCEMQDRR